MQAVYMEKLFKKELIDEFQRHPLIQEALAGCCLMNTYDFLQWFGQTIIRKNDSVRHKMADSMYHMVIEYFTSIANSACEKVVDEHYSAKAMKKILESSDFDVLVILAPHWEKLKRDEFAVKPNVSLEKKRNHVLGFIIVEKGECKRMATTYSIKLICTRSNEKLTYQRFSTDAKKKLTRQRMKGGILLGAYLFCAKRYGQTHGILELSIAYDNIEGFFSYSKQGFVKDLTLFGDDCFNDYNNLPMSVVLGDLTDEKIIEHASGDKRLELKTEDIKDDTGFIRFVPKTERQKKIQKAMVPYCNLLYKSIYLYDERMKLDPEFDGAEIEINNNVEDMFLYASDDEENPGLLRPELNYYHEYYRGMLLQLANEFNEPEPRSRVSKKNSRPSMKTHLSAPSRMNGPKMSKLKTIKRARSV